ncbi:MAG: hypothetical protein QOE01_390 [Actinomycetota bacterium]|nr:hypothetical protein [Actinomycetota bacterium]
MPAFISGLELSRRHYQEAVRPVLDAAFPGLPHSAALIGRGSEVLGFDDEMSRDHDSQPRVLLFLREADRARHGDAIGEALRGDLPRSQGLPAGHEILTVRGYVLDRLGFDIEGEPGTRDWLTFPEHELVMLTAGAVFHDDVGLQAARDRFAYYPHDVWLYLLVAGWWRIHPEANLVGRAGQVGDELGSALIGSQLVHDLMRLCFLMERQYAPYSKWFGTAFTRLACADELSPVLLTVQRARTWQEREDALMAAYGQVAVLHDALHITPPVPTDVVQLWDRQFKVVWGDFPDALHAQIRDPEVKRIAERWPVGGVDRLRDQLWDPGDRRRLLALFE